MACGKNEAPLRQGWKKRQSNQDVIRCVEQKQINVAKIEEEQKELLLNEDRLKQEKALMLRRKMAADTEAKEVFTPHPLPFSTTS